MANRGENRKIRVLLVDDHQVVRKGIARLLESERDIEIVGEASNGQEGLEATRRLRPDVVLMDSSMPVMSGAEATRRVAAEVPEAKVIGLSMYDESEAGASMRSAGAVEYCLKSGPVEELLAAIRKHGLPTS